MGISGKIIIFRLTKWFPLRLYCRNEQKHIVMRKVIFIFLLALLPLTGMAEKKKEYVRSDKLMSLVSEYKMKDGFEVVKVGSFGLSILKTALRASVTFDDDPEAREVMKLVKGVKKVAVVDYEMTDVKSREAFDSKLKKILGSSGVLAEIKDEGEMVRVYGMLSEDGSELRDFVLHVPEERALICFFGSLSVDAIARLAALD